MPTDDNFPQYWCDETDWLVDVVMLPNWEGEQNENRITLEWLARVLVFAFITDTRVLAQVGDPAVPAYEFWFSFDSDQNRDHFLQMVKDDGYADPDEDGSFDPPHSLEDLPELRPWGQVLPKEQAEWLVQLQTTYMAGLTNAEDGPAN